MKKLLILVAGGIGYVLGTKAGRERYEQMRGTFNKVKDDPRVQEKTHQATDLAEEKAAQLGTRIKRSVTSEDKLVDVADKGAAKVGASNGSSTSNGSGTSTDPAQKLNPESTALQDNPGPKGDLP